MKFKKWLKRKLPTAESLAQTKGLRWLGNWLSHHPNLVHFNRKALPLAMAIGLFIALVPLPLQTVLAAGLAFIFRVNVVVAIAVTWISNPITFVPINMAIYYLGNLLSGSHHQLQLPNIHWDWHHIVDSIKGASDWLLAQGEVYLIGWLVLSFSAAILGYLFTKLLWKWMVYYHLYQRKKHRAKKEVV